MRFSFLIFITFLSLIFTGCGGGGGGGNTISPSSLNAINNATFIDSAVAGIEYDNGDGIIRKTDEKGIFKYYENQSVKFYINGIFIGEGLPEDKPQGVIAPTKKIITPFTLANTSIRDKDNPKVLKIVKLLISLDSDNNASDGIKIDIDKLNKDEIKKLKSQNKHIDKIDLDKILKSTPKGDYFARKHLDETFGKTDEYKYSYIPANIDDFIAVRFLNKATFGATKKSIEELKQKGVLQWLDEQLNMPNNDEFMHVRRAIELAIAFEGDFFNPKSMNEYLSDDGTYFHGFNVYYMTNYQVSSWFDASLLQKDQLREKLAYALSQIVVLSTAEPLFVRRTEAVAKHYDILRNNAFKTYKDLLMAVSLSSPMSLYLTYHGNQKEHIKDGATVYPDENYAREIMQLFSIGLKELNMDGTPVLDDDGKTVPTYDQKDITEVSKVFTGWDMKYNNRFGRVAYGLGDLTHPLEFNSNYHDYGEKKVLGKTIPAGLDGKEDIEALIDILMNHKNIAPFISKQLIQRLTKSNPSPSYIKRVAEVFNNNGKGIKGDLKAVVKAIFTDPEFWEDLKEKKFVKFKEPLVAFTQFLRAFYVQRFPSFQSRVRGKVIDIKDAFYLSDPNFLGEVPGRSPTVFNFYDKDFVPNIDYFKQNNLVAPELQIQTEGQIINFNNSIYNILRTFAKILSPNGWGNAKSSYRFLLDFKDEYAVIEKELDGVVDGYVAEFDKNLSYSQDKENFEGELTPREKALKSLITHLDIKLTGGVLPQSFKDEMFKRYIEVFYDRTVTGKGDNTLREIYKDIVAPIVLAIITSRYNMSE